MPKNSHCRKPGCREQPEILGYCRPHYQEHQEEGCFRDLAVSALHQAHHAAQIEDAALKDEMNRLRRFWAIACDAVIHKRGDTVLKDEADYAMEWCIALAKELLQADQSVTAGREVSSDMAFTRDWVWHRFRNLEAGLMSNGVPRPEKR